MVTIAHPTLASRLRDRIADDGPITFRDWMAAALYDVEEGYYFRERVRWGRAGDYRTSPERSELFAATFARYFAVLHYNLGRPNHWTIFEAGAGDGRFAEHVLRSLQEFFPEVFEATSYVIDEISPHSRAVAAERLGDFTKRVDFAPLSDVAIPVGVLFSNELFDAFPVHRLIVQQRRVREFYVTVGSDGAFDWIVGDLSPAAAEFVANRELAQRSENQVFELNAALAEWIRRVATKLGRGYVITVDYGSKSASESLRETLRAFSRHQFVDNVLDNPGVVDLTTSVDWNFAKLIGEQWGLKEVEFETLDKFLFAKGILQELERCEAQPNITEAQRAALRVSAREMILPNGMAESFQVLVQEKI